MNRRDLLRTGAAVVGAGTLAGCTAHRLQEAEREPPVFEPVPVEEFDLPVTQRLGVAEAGIERATDATVRTSDGFAGYLDDQGVHVEKLAGLVEEGTPLLSLEYVVEETRETGLMHHLGVVAGGYAVLVAADHDGEKLEAHLLDSAGEEFGEYEVRREWAEKYDAGEYTARKYANEIAITAEST